MFTWEQSICHWTVRKSESVSSVFLFSCLALRYGLVTIYTVYCFWYFLSVYLVIFLGLLPFLLHFYSLNPFFPLCRWPGCLSPSDIFHQMTARLLLTQVARTITNMQQQIQQHQRQLYQALLMKQQQQLPSHSSSSSSSSAGLHPPGGPVSSKSILDPFTGPHQSSGLADSLHTKEPPSSPNAYNTYPLCKAAHHQCCALAIILKAIIINSKKSKSMFKQ